MSTSIDSFIEIILACAQNADATTMPTTKLHDLFREKEKRASGTKAAVEAAIGELDEKKALDVCLKAYNAKIESLKKDEKSEVASMIAENIEATGDLRNFVEQLNTASQYVVKHIDPSKKPRVEALMQSFMANASAPSK